MNKMSFETTVRPFGNTGHITLPVSLVEEGKGYS